MKKKRLAGLLLLAPLCLLAACGGGGPTTLPISANWYANTTRPTIDGTHEKLEYTVTFQPPSDRGDYFVDYSDGTYTTELNSCTYSFEDSSSDTVYRYTTELRMSGHYTYNGQEGEQFEDFVTSEVYFYGTSKNLRPIRSTKTVHSTNPLTSPTAESMSGVTYLQYTMVYSTNAAADAPLESATFTRVDLLAEEDAAGRTFTSDVEIEYDGSFLDNEQIYFALRGLNMTEAVDFGTNNPQNAGAVSGVVFTAVPEADSFDKDFLIGGTPRGTEKIDAYKVQFRYDATNSGAVRTALYAAKTSADGNLYRNILLRLEDPIADGYGTLFYTIRSAEFTA